MPPRKPAITRAAPREHTRRRSKPYEKYADTPFVNYVRAEMQRQGMSTADLGRAVGSQTSLVSRWLQGVRPNTESIGLIADALGLDTLHLLVLSEHLKPSKRATTQDQRLLDLISKLEQSELTEERYVFLEGILEQFRRTRPTMSAQACPGESPAPPHRETA